MVDVFVSHIAPLTRQIHLRKGWHGQPDDYNTALDEDAETTERRRANWPCTRLLDLLGPEVHHITA